MGRGLDSKTVKSAQRVLELLEYVSDERRSVTVMDVSRELNYPQSSTSELLSCLVHLGYLRHDRAQRTFHPTVRVATLGHHVTPTPQRRGLLFDMADAVHEDSGCPAMLGMIHRARLQPVYLAGDDRPLSRVAMAGPLHSAIGHALLADWHEADVRGLIHRLNADADLGDAVRTGTLIETLHGVRRAGFAISDAGPAFAGRMVAVALPQAAGESPLSLGLIVGEAAGEALIAERVAQLHGAIGRFLGRPLAAYEAERTFAAHG